MTIEIEIENFESKKLDTVKILKEDAPELGITASRYKCRNESGKVVYLVEVNFELEVPKNLQEDLGRTSITKEVNVVCENVEESLMVIFDLMMI